MSFVLNKSWDLWTSRNPREGTGGKINHDCSLFRLLVVACANNIAQTPTVLQAYRKEKLKNRFVSLFRQVRTHLFARGTFIV